MSRLINDQGLALIKSFESFRAEPYQDKGGIWTIGYGDTHGVNADTPPVTEPEAAEKLRQELTEFGTYVEETVHVEINDNQYAALLSLTENCGTAPLHSGLGKVLNQARYEEAADHFLLWDKEHIDGELVRVAGLSRRRAAERALFLAPC